MRGVCGSRGSVVDAESDYIVYGSSIVDANSEVSESEMNLFWPYLPHPLLCLSSPLVKMSEDSCW